MPHCWITCMKMYSIYPVATQFISATIKTLKSTLVLNHTVQSLSITIRDVFFFSRFFVTSHRFCGTCISKPTSSYEIYSKRYPTLSHGLVDHENLSQRWQVTGLGYYLACLLLKFSNKIRMEFGFEKCAKSTLKRGKLTETSYLSLDTGKCIRELNQEDP